MRIDDEIFELGGESTLLSLRNGGGKSVLVQMMMAPFVNKRYRDLKERTFESYFTTNKPTFILVEWALDYNAGYVLAGMMVRKRQEAQDDRTNESLEIINFIHEYKQVSAYDLYHIPLIEQHENGKKLISFGQAKILFEKLKKESSNKFNYYDMSQSNQARRYFEHLQENQIYYKEWESIIKRVNLKESGLSELFQDAKSVTGLVEKWFLKTVQDKLNRDDNKIQRFNENIEKYIKQYKANQSKIALKDSILAFEKEVEKIFQVAIDFEKELKEKFEIENTIANLVKGLEDKLQCLQIEGVSLEEKKESLLESIEELKYEALCVVIYKLLEEEEGLIQEQVRLDNREQKLIDERSFLKRELAIQNCARVYEEYTMDSQEVQKYESDLEVLHEQDKDLTPEKNNLGYTLKKYYTRALENCSKKQEQLEEELKQQATKMKALQEDITQKRDVKSRLEREQGSYSAKVKAYDKVEQNFNKKFQENLSRNIVGTYQEEEIYTRQIELRKVLESSKRNIRTLKYEKDSTEQQIKGLEKKKEDIKNNQLQKEYRLEENKKKLESCEGELIIRRELMKYVNLEEDRLFDTEGIVACFNQQIEKLKDAKLKDEITYEKEIEAYKQLETGRLLSLPQEIEEKLDALGIHAAYGMEWLRKNQIKVADNPFLPYALIMSNKEIVLLKDAKLNVYTPVPIPIVSRESLISNNKQDKEYVYQFQDINFLVSFNQDLLDAEALQRLLDVKQKEIQVLKEHIQNREKAITLNESKRNTILYQEVNEDTYIQLKETIVTLEQGIENLKIAGDQLAKQLIEEQIRSANISEKLYQTEKSLKFIEEKISEFDYLCREYEAYLEDKDAYDRNRSQLEALDQWLEDTYEQVSHLDKEKETLQTKRRSLISEYEMFQSKLNLYESYKEGTVLERDIEDLEARFESLTKVISQQESEIQQLLAKARIRYNRKEKELISLANEYKLTEEAYKAVQYDLFEERKFKEQLTQVEALLSQIKEETIELAGRKAINKDRLEREQEKLETQYHKTLKEKETLVGKNFNQAIASQKALLDELKIEENILKKKISIYESVHTSINEYKNLEVKDIIELDLNEQTINNLRSEIIRDYNQKNESTRDYEVKLQRVVRQLIQEKQFEDSFFRGPLETLEKIVSTPDIVVENLKTTLEANERIMKKLDADIGLIEKEKQSVLDGLLQYIYEVHEHIGKIDKNATVTIRGKAIKMLKINQPNWDEYEGMYEVRLRDLIEYITRTGLEKLEQNENIEELLSKYITTKNLYNEVVGINNIEVKLYKIEEEREYAITWDEVSKNSGGEGFLSAFVVLSSLLSYMRRDDTDLFGMDKESGKVLVMDNPFAQTNAAHLLKPLMDMAKKRNTQLICLSGLGGESIYNCFDNIYVLSLIASKMHEGLKYMRSEHLKGEEAIEELVAVQIQTDTIEQMQLF